MFIYLVLGGRAPAHKVLPPACCSWSVHGPLAAASPGVRAQDEPVPWPLPSASLGLLWLFSCKVSSWGRGRAAGLLQGRLLRALRGPRGAGVIPQWGQHRPSAAQGVGHRGHRACDRRAVAAAGDLSHPLPRAGAAGERSYWIATRPGGLAMENPLRRGTPRGARARDPSRVWAIPRATHSLFPRGTVTKLPVEFSPFPPAELSSDVLPRSPPPSLSPRSGDRALWLTVASVLFISEGPDPQVRGEPRTHQFRGDGDACRGNESPVVRSEGLNQKLRSYYRNSPR